MFNKVFIIGNLTRDPELRYTSSGIPVARFTVAVNRPRRKGGEEKSQVDFINVVAWRRLAEICGEFLKKGRSVAVEGRLQLRTYEKMGEKRTMAEVIADNMQMLGKKPEEIHAPLESEEEQEQKQGQGEGERAEPEEEAPALEQEQGQGEGQEQGEEEEVPF